MDSWQPCASTGIGKLFCSELAALVGVDDLGGAVALKGLLNDLLGMAGLQRRGHFVGQHLAAGHIQHGHQIDKAACHGNVGGVQCPDPQQLALAHEGVRQVQPGHLPHEGDVMRRYGRWQVAHRTAANAQQWACAWMARLD